MKIAEQQSFKDFLEIYSSNPDRVIFFAGAGLSLPLFPSWVDFLTQLVMYADARGQLGCDKSELLNKLSQGVDFLEIADYCASAIGINAYREITEKYFDKDFAFDDVPDSYKTLLSLQFKGIITTNYDRIPEIGGRGTLSCYSNKNVPEALRALERGKKIVIKIHGDILNQDSIILTRDDFQNIVHNDQAVQTALRSLFSTSTICFIGFGFSDPHFKLILDFLSAINNGRSITHYAFLTSKTKFEIDNIEKKNGIKVIEYSSEIDHEELTRFLQLLSGVKPKIEPKENIDSIDAIYAILENRFISDVGIQNYQLDFDKDSSTLRIVYLSRANTEYEQQKEILSIYNLFTFETSILNSIMLCCCMETEKTDEFVYFSPFILVSHGQYSSACTFAKKSIQSSDFWKTLKFNQPYMIGSVHFMDRQVNFPFMNF